MTHRNKLFFFTISLAIIAGGCSASRTYSYRIITNDCNCEEFRARDRSNKIEYLFRAHYRMQGGIITNIEVEIFNHNRDTLFLDQGSAILSSRNMNYQYNNKMIPLPHLVIEPLRSDVVAMNGSDISGDEDWNKIAGEQLTLTLRGIRLGVKTLSQQTVTFVPENPKLNIPEKR